ncbi:hypothetical protein CEXT_103721 [Caerostris extrusa]|uniref:Uncharacterized protein n=1 Tax=Caerostris extrusa TaxID=172846 RepID=A0AAV4QC38_CAEEX|nr:hypothetical protein CEXT_103721 [Caerostris extrusa]
MDLPCPSPKKIQVVSCEFGTQFTQSPNRPISQSSDNTTEEAHLHTSQLSLLAGSLVGNGNQPPGIAAVASAALLFLWVEGIPVGQGRILPHSAPDDNTLRQGRCRNRSRYEH